jgi:hypothetical protein
MNPWSQNPMPPMQPPQMPAAMPQGVQQPLPQQPQSEYPSFPNSLGLGSQVPFNNPPSPGYQGGQVINQPMLGGAAFNPWSLQGEAMSRI